MKNLVKIGHLTKYDAFSLNSDQVVDIEIWFKIHGNVIFETNVFFCIRKCIAYANEANAINKDSPVLRWRGEDFDCVYRKIKFSSLTNCKGVKRGQTHVLKERN